MKLKHILPESKSRDFKKRVLAILYRNGYDTMDIEGLAKEMNCSWAEALNLVRLIGDGGTYGEVGIKDRVMHRLRAPQKIYKLMLHFNFPTGVIKKIVNLYNQKNRAFHSTQRVNDSDNDRLMHLKNGERLATIMDKKFIDTIDDNELQDYAIAVVPWADKLYQQEHWKDELTPHYVTKAENADIIDAFMKQEDRGGLDLLHGLAFGYKMQDVYNFVRHRNPELVDAVAGP